MAAMLLLSIPTYASEVMRKTSGMGFIAHRLKAKQKSNTYRTTHYSDIISILLLYYKTERA